MGYPARALLATCLTDADFISANLAGIIAIPDRWIYTNCAVQIYQLSSNVSVSRIKDRLINSWIG